MLIGLSILWRNTLPKDPKWTIYLWLLTCGNLLRENTKTVIKGGVYAERG
jgi:hypothetical protein